MMIPDPIARDGDLVTVLNYRKKPGEWERGTARDPEFHLTSWQPPGRWRYTVFLERRSSTDRAISVTVGDDGTRALRGKKKSA